MQGEKDWEKYEIARQLKTCVDDIRNHYHQDLRSKEMGKRQRAVALYFIDKVWFWDSTQKLRIKETAMIIPSFTCLHTTDRNKLVVSFSEFP